MRSSVKPSHAANDNLKDDLIRRTRRGLAAASRPRSQPRGRPADRREYHRLFLGARRMVAGRDYRLRQMIPASPTPPRDEGRTMTADEVATAIPLNAPTVFSTEPAEAGKGDKGGDRQITNAEFIAAVFPNLAEGLLRQFALKAATPI